MTSRNNEHRKKGAQDNDRFYTATADRSRTQILPSTGEVIQIDRWQKGYTATSFNDGNRAENEAIKDKFNEKLGVSKAQEQAMLAGSMIRWDSIAAKPKNYDENGKAIKPKDYER